MPKHKLLLVAFALQFILIGMMFEVAYSPLMFGDEVRTKVRGYDPRDIISGNYILLSYDVPLPDDVSLSDEYFVPLELNKDGLYQFLAPKTYRPKGLFIHAEKSRNGLKLGIEKYYLPIQKAQNYERKLRNTDAIAILKVFNGRARIVDLKFIDSP